MKLLRLVAGALALMLGATLSAHAMPPPRLLADTNIAPGFPLSSTPSFGVTIAGITYFSAATRELGNELWRTDGTAGGTVLVKDIAPRSAGSYPNSFVAFRGLAYFVADDGMHGRELWRSNGTAAGTVLVKDLVSGAAGSAPEIAPTSGTSIVAGNVLFFAATDGRGTELWRSDGTEAGTYLLKDIFPGVESSSPRSFAALGSQVFFAADDGSTGRELWKSDGTPDGTQSVGDVVSGPSGLDPSGTVTFGDALFFGGDDGVNGIQLWRSDGTAEGTALFKQLRSGADSSPVELVVIGPTLFFVATSDESSRELFRSDGTADGTTPIKDIYPPERSGQPEKLTPAGAILFFFADGALWTSDGTTEGTVRVKNASIGSLDRIVAIAGGIYFSNGSRLWFSDGTEASTGPVQAPPATNLFDANGILLFSGSDNETGGEPWKISPLQTDAQLIKDIVAGNSTSYGFIPAGTLPTVVGSAVFFEACDFVQGCTLWRSDGTPTGTALADDVWPGPPAELFDIESTGNELFLASIGGLHAAGLWKSDGASPATLVNSVNPNGPDMVNAGGRLFFGADDGVSGPELWTSDGSTEGTKMVKDIQPGPLGSGLGRLVPFGNRVFFSAVDPPTGEELWVSDGTDAGTFTFDINPGEGRGVGSLATLPSLSGSFFFFADDGVHGYELWKSDGTIGGTMLVRDIFAPGSGRGIPISIAAAGGRIFFAGMDDRGMELWKSDGSEDGTVLVKDISTGSSDPQFFGVGLGRLFFTANNGRTGFDSWVSDGTETGTFRLRDDSEVSRAFAPRGYLEAGGVVFFAASDAEHGLELWRTDGTVGGTALFADINPFGSSFPGTVGVVDGALLFTADDGVAGFEPWILLTLCGDGRRNFGEECDDGNMVDDDDCASSCELVGPRRCTGDCDGDSHVTIDEVVRGIHIALDLSDADDCPAFDTNDNHRLTIAELVEGINNALHGCPTDDDLLGPSIGN